MSFVSFAFAAFFLFVLVLRLALARLGWHETWRTVLLVASLVFYGWHVPAYLLVLAVPTTVDFLVARRIAVLPVGAPARRALLVLSLVVNQGLLALFK
jgi:alginate O-acetyltransferase complex protein AlgI